MNLLNDIITYIRRIIKAPSNTSISNDLLIDYINRFWIMDVPASIQLFDLKKKYQFHTIPGIDRYNMPLYDVQTEPGNQTIGMYPVYQGFVGPAYINGIQVPFQTQKDVFFLNWPNVVQYQAVVATGDGTPGPYTLNFPIGPNNIPPINPPIQSLIRGHIDITGIITLGTNVDPPIVGTVAAQTTIPAIPVTSVDSSVFITTLDGTGNNVVIQDSGQFLSGPDGFNYGLLMSPGKAPNGNSSLGLYSTVSNTVNYLTGTAIVTFPVSIPSGNNINVQCFMFQGGIPRCILYYDNTLTLRSPPASQYLVELDAYLSPAAFLVTAEAIPFGYMAEYIARGAARKILSDTGDIEQFQFYEPLFKEQETLVHIRSERQWTATRTQTIYSQGMTQGPGLYNNSFGGAVL